MEIVSVDTLFLISITIHSIRNILNKIDTNESITLLEQLNLKIKSINTHHKHKSDNPNHGSGEDVPPVVSVVGDPSEGTDRHVGDAQQLEQRHQQYCAVPPAKRATLEVPLGNFDKRSLVLDDTYSFLLSSTLKKGIYPTVGC